jgi:hypothetical protein
METINPGVFFTGAVTVALLAFAGTVGRHYRDELQREAVETGTARATAPATPVTPVTPVAPAATAERPPLTLIRGGRAQGTAALRDRAGRAAAEEAPRAA